MDPTDRNFASEFVKERKYPYVVAVDAGLAVCEDLGLVPDLAVGDFDTFGLERMEELRKKEGWATDVHKPEKDETDTDLASARRSVPVFIPPMCWEPPGGDWIMSFPIST